VVVELKIYLVFAIILFEVHFAAPHQCTTDHHIGYGRIADSLHRCAALRLPFLLLILGQTYWNERGSNSMRAMTMTTTRYQWKLDCGVVSRVELSVWEQAM
jgi:hypothetical protein